MNLHRILTAVDNQWVDLRNEQAGPEGQDRREKEPNWPTGGTPPTVDSDLLSLVTRITVFGDIREEIKLVLLNQKEDDKKDSKRTENKEGQGPSEERPDAEHDKCGAEEVEPNGTSAFAILNFAASSIATRSIELVAHIARERPDSSDRC